MMAAADYADGRLPNPPPIIRAAVRYGAQVRNDLDVPAGMPQKLARLHGVYESMKSYIRAGKQGNTVAWANANPEHWELVSWVIAGRKRG